MKYKYAVPLFALIFLMQATIMNTLAVFKATPNLLLCLIILISFMYANGNSGIACGVAFGLLYDLCFGPVAGVSALLYFLIGIACMMLSDMLNKENFATVVLITACMSFAYNLLYWLAMLIMGDACTFMYFLKNQPLRIFYNVTIISIMYFLTIKRVVKYRQDRYFN